MQWYLRPVGRIGRSWLLPKGFSHGRSGTVTLPSSLSSSAPLTDPSIVWEFLTKTATHNKSNASGSPADAATHNCMAGGGGRADNLPPPSSRRCRVASAAGHSVNTTVKLVRSEIVPVRFLTRSPLITSPCSLAKIKGENLEGQIRLGFQLLNAKACPAQCTSASPPAR